MLVPKTASWRTSGYFSGTPGDAVFTKGAPPHNAVLQLEQKDYEVCTLVCLSVVCSFGVVNMWTCFLNQFVMFSTGTYYLDISYNLEI